MRRGLGDHVHDHGPQVGKGQPRLLPPGLGPSGRYVQRGGGDERIGRGAGRAIGRDHVCRSLLRSDDPVGVLAVRPEIQFTAARNALEPVALVRQRQVPDQAQAAPAGRQHRPAQLLVVEAVELGENGGARRRGLGAGSRDRARRVWMPWSRVPLRSWASTVRRGQRACAASPDAARIALPWPYAAARPASRPSRAGARLRRV